MGLLNREQKPPVEVSTSSFSKENVTIFLEEHADTLPADVVIQAKKEIELLSPGARLSSYWARTVFGNEFAQLLLSEIEINPKHLELLKYKKP